MRLYRPSHYNYYFSQNGKFLIFNSLTGEILTVTQELFFSIKDNELDDNDSNIELMKAKGFITQRSSIEDERDAALELYQEAVNRRTLQLTIIVTGQCNLRCVYCYEHFEKPKMSLETQAEIVLYLKNALNRYDGLYVSWFGGEPLMAIDVIESLSKKIQFLCNSLGKKYVSSITTNGVLLTPKIHTLLEKCSVKDFQITLDGNRKIHDKQRITPNGKGSYDIIYNNLLSMKASEYQYHATIRINVALDTALDKDFKLFFKLLYKDFGQDNRFNLHLAAVSDLAGKESGLVDICDTAYLSQYYAYAQNTGFKFSHYKILFKPLHLVCYAANPNAFVIDADGVIHKCTVALYNSENKIGYLNGGKMILNREKEKLWCQENSQEYSICSSCQLFPTCLGKFCPLETIQGNVPACPPMKKNLDMYMKLFLNGSDNL